MGSKDLEHSQPLDLSKPEIEQGLPTFLSNQITIEMVRNGQTAKMEFSRPYAKDLWTGQQKSTLKNVQGYCLIEPTMKNHTLKSRKNFTAWMG